VYHMMLDFTTAVITLLLISIVASCVSLIVILCKAWRKKAAIRLMLYVTVCDLIAEIFWFLSIMNEACPSLGAIEMFGFNASSFWICSVGFNLWYTTASIKTKPPHEIYFHIVCWGVPLILTFVALLIDAFAQFGPPNGCWLNDGNESLLFYPLSGVLSFLVNLFFIGTTVYRLFKSRINSSMKPLKTRAKVLLSLQCFFVIYNIGIILQFIYSNNVDSIGFNIGLCLASLTGFLNASAISGFSVWQKLTSMKKKVSEDRMSSTLEDL